MFRAMRRLPTNLHRLNSFRVDSKGNLAIRRASQKNKQDLCPPKEVRSSSGTAYTFGAIAITVGAVIGYAKYDDKFRKTITLYVPQFDDMLATIFLEDKDDETPKTAVETPSKKKPGKLVKSKKVTEQPIDYKAPAPVFDKMAEETKSPIDYTEIRVADKVPGVPDPVLETHSGERRENEKTIMEKIVVLETQLAEVTQAAVQSFNKGLYTLKSYNSDIQVVIEESPENVHPDVWSDLKEKTMAKKQAMEAIELQSQEVKCVISQLNKLLSFVDPSPATESLIERVKLNISRVQEDLKKARRGYEEEIENSKLTEKYWEKVAEARKGFISELEALFPTVKFSEKEVTVSSADLDLFVLHAISKVLFFQRELAKVDTVGNKRLEKALEDAKRTGSIEPLTREQICLQLEQEKRNLELLYSKKCLKLRQQSEAELRGKLKLQSEAFTDHLEDAIKTREMEVERLLHRKFDEQLQAERTKYKLEVSAMVGRLKGMEDALKARSSADKSAKNAQILWTACQTLIKAVKTSAVGKAPAEQLRPLQDEIRAVHSAANENDELINAVIASIPSEALKRGVFPEDVLRERFISVEKVARNLSLLPSQGGRLHVYILSYLQSKLLMNASTTIPSAELDDQAIDFTKLNNYDILQRARYWLDRGDFAQALRYMNLLKGASRTIARQWMNEARILLETQQAASTLMAYATSSGLMYL